MFQDDEVKVLTDLARTVLEEPKPEQFLAHLVHRTLSEIEARGATLGVIEREGFIDLQGSFGYESDYINPYTRIPLWTPLPITDAAKSGKIQFIASREELVIKYPSLSNSLQPNYEGATTAIPVTFRNTVIGVLYFNSLKQPKEGFEFSSTTEGLTALCGLYIRNLIANRQSNTKDYVTSTKSLTPRQKQIIQLFKEDLTTDQMAERLKYSSSTIKQDIIKIYSIFGVNNRMAVVHLAEKVGLS